MTTDSIERRALGWFAGGDTGSSSKAIARHMLGLPRNHCLEPSDPSDLGRCLRLLDMIPEWQPRIAEMAEHGPRWAALIARWDELHASMDDEVGIDWSKDGTAPKTYALMRSILDAVNDPSVIRVGRMEIRI